MKTDTIAAIGTALSESGIGIIRISGNNAIETADHIFRNKKGERILTKVEKGVLRATKIQILVKFY